MRSPSIGRLVAQFDISREAARRIKKLCALADDRVELEKLIDKECATTSQYARRCYDDPYSEKLWRRTMVLHAINELIPGAYGVEALGEGASMYDGPPYEYLNMGDPYVATLVYKRDTDNLYIGSWGDVAEKLTCSSEG